LYYFDLLCIFVSIAKYFYPDVSRLGARSFFVIFESATLPQPCRSTGGKTYNFCIFREAWMNFLARRWGAWPIAALCWGLNGPALAEQTAAVSWTDGFSLDVREGDRLSFYYSPYTYHFTASPEHRDVWLVGLERERSDQRVSGITYFSNSFGQPSTYIYPWGQNYPNLGGVDGLFAKWSMGLLYGYVGAYQNKVPLNVGGFSPAIIPSLGFERAGYSTQINLLGTAGLMWHISVPMGR